MPHVTDQSAAQPSPAPIRVTEDASPPPRTVTEEIRNARAVLAMTGDWNQNNPAEARDAAVLLHFRMQRLLDALDAERAPQAVTA